MFLTAEGGRRLCACVYKYDIITHSCDSGRGAEQTMTPQSSVQSGAGVQELPSPVMQPHLRSRRHGNHPSGCSSSGCGVALLLSPELVQGSAWERCGLY